MPQREKPFIDGVEHSVWNRDTAIEDRWLISPEDVMKKRVKIFFWGVVCFWLLGMSRGFAEPSCMRCEKGRNLVCIGSPASVVLAKCGSPLSIVDIGSKKKTRSSTTVTGQETRINNETYHTRPSRSSTTLTLEEWTYCIQGSYGNDCYLYILRFKGDTLTKITFTMEKGN
jgi:hypothetical protein